MNNSLRILIVTLSAILVVGVVLLVGFTLGRASFAPLNVFNRDTALIGDPTSLTDGFWMGPGVMGSGRMGAGFGMMRGGNRMMGYGSASGLVEAEPLSLDEVQEAVDRHLARLDDENLVLGEVMIFDNHGYAQIVEKDTGIGAMEVLVDPRTRAVSPEHGPNMMWNLKYSTMANFNGFGRLGMMGGGQQVHGRHSWMMGSPPAAAENSEMTIKPAEAISIAQEYLSTYFPNTTADDHADAFYGYYTIHTLENGEVVGMLSVNGFTGQVFPHTWHGELVEMGGEADH